jgi:predicted lipopolysaccharide heptosyltransferase III
MFDLAKVRQILVIKLRYIGDVLLCTPVIESLKRSLPQASITMLVNAGTEEVLSHNPYLHDVVVVPQNKDWRRQTDLILRLRSKRFDLALDLTDGDRSAILGFLSGASYRVGFNSENRWRGVLYHRVVKADRHGMHAVNYHLEMLQDIGCKLDHHGPRLYPSDHDRSVADRGLFDKGLPKNSPFAVIHPGSRWWFKSWPPEKFSDLAKRIHGSLGYSVIVVGGPKDVKAADEIVLACGSWVKSLAGQISLLQLAALVQRALLFVGNDAGPMHIAAAMGTPVVALFGPTDPQVWGPWGAGHEVIWKQMDCNPCWQSDCQRGELNCMRQITVDEVWQAVTRILNKNSLHV